jgi:hypothetical protein
VRMSCSSSAREHFATRTSAAAKTWRSRRTPDEPPAMALAVGRSTALRRRPFSKTVNDARERDCGRGSSRSRGSGRSAGLA